TGVAGGVDGWQAALPTLTQRPPYACPRCTGNRASFTLLWPVTWSVRKNARTGQVEEWRAGPALAMAAGGEPDLTVRCELCGFSGPESMFTAAARRLPPPFQPGPGAGG
ncbi:MAG TPA: acyl transferase, partial [Thermaerobacter sp.]